MAYDEALADRIRELVASEKGLTEKKMFGGLAFLINGNMAVAASGQGGMLLRCDPADTAAFVKSAHVDRMEMRGRAMDGWLRVGDDAIKTKAAITKWVDRGVAYAKLLPPK
ncbi:MAG TPA: TfoX/Sxy family protein [Jatrophihabitantaceae bacterium]|nr:TfoX/Sxy family protein [Jatrophihabitantaceae bacterium]